MRRFFVVLLTVVLVVGPLMDRSYANLDDALDWLFMSASTQPKVYESQRRMGWVGGTVMARTPIKSVNIISFAPPKLDAGCGGIDLFMGSFSFINMEQFMQLLRAIAANAVGLAFKAALHAISPTLEAIISKLETLVNNMNRTFRNSCEIAKSIPSLFSGIGSVGDSIKQVATDIADLFRVGTGVVEDRFKAALENYTNPNMVYEPESKPDLNPSVGNLVWKAFFLNNAAAYIGDPRTGVGNVLGSDGKLMAMYVMSITGTVVNMPPEGQDLSSCEGSDGDADRCSIPARVYGPILRFKDFLHGNRGDNKPQYYQCNTTASEMGCTALTPATFPFEGTYAYTSRMLFGTPDGYITGEYTSDSIVGRVIGGGELSTQQKVFLDTVPAPILSAMIMAQRDPNAVTSIAYLCTPFVAESLAVAIGDAIIKAAQAAFAGQYKVDKPSDYDRNLEIFAREVGELRMKAKEQIDFVNALRQYAKGIAESGYPYM